MSINLSDLTSPNNQDSLAEITSGADFLDPIGKLENLSRSPNSGSDALQTVALNQPKALPLIKNPSGDLGGYLYIPDVSGNYATGPSVTIGANQTWEGELDMVITQWGNYIMPMGGGDWAAGFGLLIYDNGNVNVLSKGGPANYAASGVTLGTPFSVKYGFDGTNLYADIDNVRKYSETAPSQAASITHNLELNQQTLTNVGNYAIQKAKLTVGSSVIFDCDFNGSTSIRHGDTKFQAAVGGPVVLNQSGNDPITVVKKDILRFDGANDGLQGLFGQTITEGYMFAAFSVLGDGGENYGRVFGVNSTGEADNGNPRGYIFSLRNAATNDLSYYYDINYRASHTGLFDDELRDILHESKAADGTQVSKVNNSDIQTTSVDISALSSEEYNIAFADNGNNNAAIDLEFLALFSADSVPDEATASKIRDYINKRNQIYLRHQTDGFYFFDPQKIAAGDVTSWNGNITGSDLGDTDVATNVTIVQGSQTSQPNADGYSLTFEDNTQHLEWASAYTPNFPAGQTKAWQIVGTSLGTFAYLTQGSVTELNLLGNLGSASYRQAGDLYGIILLPESATGADIEAARKLLIDRGAADGTTASNYFAAWVHRVDIVNFKNVDMTSATNVSSSWEGTSLSSFDLSLPAVTNVRYTWFNCSSLSDFRTTDIRNGNSFTSAWNGCSALTSFPSGAKLGTEASNVNFTSAWQSSGLTSFSTPLPTATTLINSFRQCNSLISFDLDEIPLATNCQTAWALNPALTSFSTKLPKCGFFNAAWYNCSALTDFSADVFSEWNPSSIESLGVFNNAWDGCTSLTAQSVENILTSIDASGHYATTNKVSGGPALADAGIDIDYNVATGSLSAATNSAIDSLKTKGWSIFINSVEQ